MVSTFAPSERKLYQKIADRLRDYIVQGDFKVGSRLPPERDLTQLLGVSRPSLREALIALEIEGSIEIRMGSGVYVAARPSEGGARTGTHGESPTELMQARALIEGEAVVLACMHGKKSDYRYLKDCIDAMRASIEANRPPLEDDRGMLFQWPGEAPREQSFWMRNTPSSLDLLYIDPQGRIVSIASHATPFSEAPIPSNGAANGVLELRAGRAQR